MPRKINHDIVPHVVQEIYDDDGRLLAQICDNFVVKTKEEVDGILKELGRLWSESIHRAYRTLEEGTAPPEELERCRRVIEHYEKCKIA